MVCRDLLASPDRVLARYSRTGTFNLLQLSMMEKMTPIFGPTSLLPRCSQFFLPIAIGRIEFSARLVESGSALQYFFMTKSISNASEKMLLSAMRTTGAAICTPLRAHCMHARFSRLLTVMKYSAGFTLGQLTKRTFLYAKGVPCQVDAIEPGLNMSGNP